MTAHLQNPDPASHAVANVIMSSDQPTQAEQDLTACNADIVCMIQAIHSQWRHKLDIQIRFKDLPSIARALACR